MQLPKEEKNVLDVLWKAKGKPLKSIEIAETLGIYDCHCNKLISFLRKKGYEIENRFCEVDGKKQKYKEHWIETEKQRRIKSLEKLQDTYPYFHTEYKKINIQIEKLRS